MRRRTIVIGIGVLVAFAAVAAAAGGYAYFFSGLRSAPRPLALSPASPAAAATSGSPAVASSGLAGTWTVAAGSQAEYRVSEVFAGTTSPHEAVARTSSVRGGLTAAQGGSGLEVSALQFTAQLASLQSVDTVAGRDVAFRDRIVQQTLAVGQYPTATFQAQSVTLPAGLDSGQTVSVTVPGQLTIHGVTRAAQIAVQARLSGSQVQATGSTSFVMTDFGFQPPALPITTVDPHVTLDFSLVLSKG